MAPTVLAGSRRLRSELQVWRVSARFKGVHVNWVMDTVKIHNFAWDSGRRTSLGWESFEKMRSIEVRTSTPTKLEIRLIHGTIIYKKTLNLWEQRKLDEVICDLNWLYDVGT